MSKRLFFVLPALFVFSLLFVQVSEADDGPATGTYTVTVTKIGFYTSETAEPDTIIDLPSPQTVHMQIGGETAPSINDFVYLGNTPNGTFLGIGVYAESFTPTDPELEPGWLPIGFDNEDTHTFTDSSRNNITIHMKGEASYASVTDL